MWCQTGSAVHVCEDLKVRVSVRAAITLSGVPPPSLKHVSSLLHHLLLLAVVDSIASLLKSDSLSSAASPGRRR